MQLPKPKSKQRLLRAGRWFPQGDVSIGKRLAACFLAIIILIILADGLTLWQFRRIEVSSERLRKADQALQAVVRVDVDIGGLRDRVAVMANSQEAREFEKDTASLRARFLDDVERARGIVVASPEVNLSGTISSSLETLKTAFPAQLDAVSELANAGDWAAVRLRLGHQIQDLRDLSLSRLEEASEQLTEAQGAALKSTTQTRRNLFVVVPFAALLTLLAAAVLGWHLTRSITVPLSELASGARALARGDFQHHVNIVGNDELAALGRTFNQTARQVQELYQELREQASLLSLTHDSIYVRDMNGVIRYWNPGAEVLYGWSAEQAVGEVAHEFLKTIFPLPFAQIKAELLRSGRWEGELTQSRKDGTQVVVATRWSVKRDEHGAPVAILVTTNDISVRKQAQENLQRSEAYLAEAQTLSHTGSWAFDIASNRYIYVSEECLRIFGFQPQDSLPTREAVFQRIHPDDSARVNRNFEMTIREKADSSDEFRIVLPDGAVEHVHVIRHPVVNSMGEIVQLFGTAVDITERKRAEEALRNSEAYLAEAQRLSQTGSWAFSPVSMKMQYWSDETFRIWGFDPQDGPPTQEQLFKRIHPDDRATVKANSHKATREKTDMDYEFRVVLPDGSMKYIHTTLHVVLDARGEILKFIGTNVDVTKAKRAEEALRRSEQELRDVIETIPVMAFSARTDGFVEFVNRRYLDYTNLTPETAKGSSWQATVHPDDLERTTSKWLEALATGKPLENELRHRNTKGEYRWFSVRAMPLRDEHRNIVKWYGVLFDIEDRKRAEQAFRESETRFRTFVDHAGDALFVYDLEQGTVLDVNREACESLGYTREEIIDKTPMAFHADSYQAELESLAERVALGQTVFDTHWHRRKDGTMFPVEVHTSRVLYGGRQFLLTVARDISDRLRAEEAVRQSEKQLREVIETMPAVAWTMSPEGALEFVNKRWQEYTGMSLQEAAGFGWKSAFYPKDIDRYLESRSASLTSGTLFEDEVRIRSRGGEYRWFISRAVPLRDEQGKIVRWYGTATDIHDRKQAEERVQVENIVLREEIDKASMFEEVVGASPALQTVLSAVSKVAPTDSTVLLTGQTGTGKELIARAIHKKSERSGRPFISVNCAAIPQSLIASELFGHEKGAFTGALQRHLGKFELAERGTIFLDEIGELPMETQVALLRVLQEREIQRVGGSQAIRVNVRILAATNRDLQKAIAAGTFREDLFYRLNVFPVHVPPLRERKEDIPMLVEYFIDRFARKAGKDIRNIDKQSLELLESYSWPGNIRELQNVVERSVVLCDTDTLRIDSSWLSLGDSTSASRVGSLASKIHEQERDFIERALAEAEGKVSGPLGAAAKLGISPSALEYKIRLLKINKHQFKKYLRES